ncbi:MAG TPA: glycosyltransferase family A protein [Candidatus Sulfotelmatobacter sp.]|nr:glycosyltransferase family A protein [Candidatus Sulfotelmatobacter sp.]
MNDYDKSTVASPSPRYCIITAARDEEQFIADTIDSVCRQAIRPIEWIIVDDGSKDRTGAIVGSYLKDNSWIRLITRKDRTYRSKGGGVEAFLEAYSMLHSHNWDYLVNLDADTTCAPDYFEQCFEQFHRMPSLGIGGGTVYTKMGQDWQPEPAPAFHVRGAAKIYRKQCWEALGGLWPGLGWDTVDEVKANQLGWRTLSFPHVKLFQQRLSGQMWGAWRFAVMDGEADYIVGYLPLFFGLKCLRHVFSSPFFVRSLGMLYGYLRCVAQRSPRVDDQEFVKYLRRQQLRRLLGMSSIWR